MNSKAHKELRDFFKLFLNTAGVQFGYIFSQDTKFKNDLNIVISYIPKSQKSIERKLLGAGEKWIKNNGSAREQSNSRSKLNIFKIDSRKTSYSDFRLMCTIIQYSKDLTCYFFAGTKKTEETDINKINKLCNVLAKLIISYFEQEVHPQTNNNTSNFLEYIINNSPDQIFIKDKDFRYIFSNKSHCEAHGLKISEIIGKSTYDLGFSKEQIEGNPNKGIRGFLRDDKDALTGNIIRNRFDPVTIADGSIRIHDTYKIPFRDNDKIVGILGYARDITDWHDDLVERTQALNEKTTALKVLLEQIDEGKSEISKNISTNVDKLIIPYIDKLKAGIVTNQQKILIEIIETNLYNIITPFAKEMSAPRKRLTPVELRVASLIKEGKTTEEIANALCLAVGTVVTHRANIRKKLGLRNSKVNLRTYLDSGI